MKYTSMRLLQMYFDKVEVNEKYWEEVDLMLREFFKNNATFQYSQEYDMVKMVENIIGKMNK